MKIKLLLCLLILSLVYYFSYNYIYQEHRDILLEDENYNLMSDSIYKHFINNQTEANNIYINRIIKLNGNVNKISHNHIIIHPGIACKIDSNFGISKIELNEQITVKGRCIGFDDLFLEVKLDNTIIIDDTNKK